MSSQLNQTVILKLEQKVQQLNLLLLPEGRLLLQRAKDDFIGGQIDVRALTDRIKDIKDRFTSPQTIQAFPIQSIQPRTPNISSQASPSPQTLQTGFTEEEQAMFKNMKTMSAEERKQFVSSNPQARDLLKKLQQIKSSKTETNVVVTQPQIQQSTPPLLQSSSTQPIPTQPPTKKKKVDDQQTESHVHPFTNDDEVHSFYASRFQPEVSFLNSTNLRNKITRILKTQQLKPTVSDSLVEFISLAVQDRMRSIVEELVLNSKTRMDTPINASDNTSFIDITSTSNYSLVNRELRIKQKILQEDEQRREEEERIKEAQRKKQSGSSEGKRKRNQNTKEDEEQKMSDMNVAIDVALGKKSSSTNLNQSNKTSTLKKTPSSSNVASSKQSNGQELDDESSQLGKRPSSIVVTSQDVILYLETEPLLRKSRLLHSLYLKLKE